MVSDGQGFVAQVGEAIVGPGGGAAVALIVIVCVLGSLGVMQMLAPRLYFAMAQDGLFPAAAAAVHPRFGTPARAIANAGGARSRRSSPLGTFDTIVAVLRVHHRRVHRRDRRLGVRVAAPLSGVQGARVSAGRRSSSWRWWAILLTLLALNNPVQAALGLGLVAAALPVYHLFGRCPALRVAGDLVMTWIRVIPFDKDENLRARVRRSRRCIRSNTPSRRTRITPRPKASWPRTA